MFLAINNRRLIVWLTESTYKRTLQRTLEDLRGNTPDLSESVLYDELIDKSKTLDIFDLMDALPDYMESIGLPNAKIIKWVEYCKNRTQQLKEYLDNES